jgi:hypothetical protein
LAAHVVLGGQAGGEHDGVVGTLLRGRGAVAGQVGAGFVGVLGVGAQQIGDLRAAGGEIPPADSPGYGVSAG